MRVPAVDIRYPNSFIEQVTGAWRGMLETGRLSQGAQVEGFEDAFAGYTGVRHAVAVASGSAALEILLQATGPHRRAIVPANTNFATYMAAMRTGSAVTLCDVDPATLSPDLAMIEAAVAASPDRPTVMLLVHMGGIISPAVREIADWCAANRVTLIEDCAHAHGSERDGRNAGRFGVAGAYSFFATKVLPIGEGGMIVTDDEAMAAECALLRNMGKHKAFVSVHERLATNARMAELPAAIGRWSVALLPEFVGERRRVLHRYAATLVGAVDLIVPDHPYSGYKALVNLPEGVDRQQVKEAMARREIYLQSEIYELPLHRQPAISDRHVGESYLGAESSCARQLCLPIYPSLSDDAVDLVARSLLEVLGR
jgi:dTDP-4-amino-4,6-dideoxygalactose transaminase